MVDTPSQTDTYTSALDIYDRSHPLLVDASGNLKVTVGGTIPISGTVIANPTVYTRVDTYTTTTTGGVVDVSTTTAKYFSIQVAGTGASPTSWSVVLEGSIDGMNYTTILTHNTSTLNNIILFSGATASPSLYFRSRCTAIVLSPATSIVVTLVGTS